METPQRRSTDRAFGIGKLSNNATTAIVVIAGFFYLGFQLWRSPENAAGQVLPVVASIVTIVKILYALSEAQAASSIAADAANVAAEQAAAAKRTAAIAVESSQQNNTQLAAVVRKVDTNTAITQQAAAQSQQAVAGIEVVHGVVNHSKDVMVDELAELRKTSSAQGVEIAQLRAAVMLEKAGVTSDAVKEAAPTGADATPIADAVKDADAAKPPTTIPKAGH